MMKHGGKRPGAGRKSGTGKFGEPTELIRIPKSLCGDVDKLVHGKKISTRRIPLYLSSVPAGSPSFLEDSVDRYVDLNDFCVRDPETTFMVMATGDSMLGANIKPGDVLIVDRSLEPCHGNIVIAVVDDNLTVKRLDKKSKTVILKPENDQYEPIKITSKNTLHIWGVVTHIIHKSL
jgi:DNA polymerase V